MTDRELLELAAKACGWTVVRDGDEAGSVLLCGIQHSWNPLHSDGDRYRLAKRLDIRIHFGPQYVTCVADGICRCIRWPEDVSDDAYAIVTAAAKMGKGMP